jgi:hypothetical protein
MLRRGGLSPSPWELAAVLANYAGLLALTASLHGAIGALYEEPAITFTADVAAGDAAVWGD